jgi:predicted RNase H-like HicB family nuclease
MDDLDLEWTEVPGKGWVVHAPDIRATAQGETKEEARANLQSLIETYPEVLKEY